MSENIHSSAEVWSGPERLGGASTVLAPFRFGAERVRRPSDSCNFEPSGSLGLEMKFKALREANEKRKKPEKALVVAGRCRSKAVSPNAIAFLMIAFFTIYFHLLC